MILEMSGNNNEDKAILVDGIPIPTMDGAAMEMLTAKLGGTRMRLIANRRFFGFILKDCCGRVWRVAL